MKANFAAMSDEEIERYDRWCKSFADKHRDTNKGLADRVREAGKIARGSSEQFSFYKDVEW